jgi:iron-sulfur cluster repair protein YtfE (RIC family)
MMLTRVAARIPVLFKTFTDRKLDAIEILIRDHLKIESLFVRFQVLSRLSERIPGRATGIKRRRDRIFLQIRKELEKHMIAEEQVFYPACEAHEGTHALAMKSFEKHEQVKTLIRDLNHLSLSDEAFEPKLILLMEDVIDHVREEEEMLFPRARKIFTRSHLLKMAAQIRSNKKHVHRSIPRAA